jgi:phosphosulfolactate phosphohydrolase-like enzyme
MNDRIPALLAAMALFQASNALACAEMIEVPLTPDRAEMYEKQRESLRADLAAARREAEAIRARLKDPALDAATRGDLAQRGKDQDTQIALLQSTSRQVEMVLRSGREQTYKGAAGRPGEPPPRCR